VCVCFVQRKNLGSIARQQTVLKACRKRSDEANDLTINGSVSCADDDKPVVDKLHDSLVYGDHLYCRTETETALSSQSVEPVLTESNVNTESMKPLLSKSSTCCVKTESEMFDELSVSVSHASADSHRALSDETCDSESTLPHCCSAETTMQSLDAVSVLGEMSELHAVETEDTSLSSSATSGVGTVTDSRTDQLTDSVFSEVVDLSDGQCVELECQCGAHYSDPTDKLHVVECQQCHSHQHAACVNYDLTDPLRGHYLCPHCRVVEVSALYSHLYCMCSLYSKTSHYNGLLGTIQKRPLTYIQSPLYLN